MLTITKTYTDLNGNERTEDFLFHLNEVELEEWDLTEGGLIQKMKDIIKENDKLKIINIIKDIILKAYGVKSEDGRRFIKSSEITEDFKQSIAFPMIYMDICKDDIAAINFVRGILPVSITSKLPTSVDEIKKQAEGVIDSMHD